MINLQAFSEEHIEAIGYGSMVARECLWLAKAGRRSCLFH